MKIDFEAEKHEYRVDGERVPSVTQVLDAVLRPRHRADEVAMLRGTAVHGFIAEHFLDDDEAPEGIAETIAHFRAFRDLLGLSPALVEERLWSESLRVAGTLDCLAYSRNTETFWLIDWKSGPIEPWHHLQLAAYASMVEEAVYRGAVSRDFLSAQAAVVSLKNKLPRPVLVAPGSIEAFRAVALVYHWNISNGGNGHGAE